jgi:phosphofructokinase-like protein
MKKKTTKNQKRIAVLTGGGDCPGLNAAIRSVTKVAQKSGYQVLGVKYGFRGFFDDEVSELTHKDVSGILSRGGTILKSSRFNPFAKKSDQKFLAEKIKSLNLDGLVVIGGDGSLGVAKDCYEKLKVPVIGIPKTIDNDVCGTDYTIGFHTAVSTAVDAIDKLHTTAESHDFVMIVEVMGRHSGYLAGYAGLASGADFIMVPEKRVQIKNLEKCIRDRKKLNKNSTIIVVAEDAKLYDGKKQVAGTDTVHDSYGKIKLGGVGWMIKKCLQLRLDHEVRCTVLGHVQRGGEPVAFDRLLATQMGYAAVGAIESKKFGQYTVYESGQIKLKSLKKLHDGKKRLSPEFYEVAEKFFV